MPWITLVSGVVIMTTVLIAFLFNRSSIQTLKESFDQLSPLQVHQHIQSLPPALIVRNQQIINWNTNYDRIDEEQCLITPLDEETTLINKRMSDGHQLITSLLFMIWAFFFLQNKPHLQVRKLTLRFILKAAALPVLGILILWILFRPLSAMGVPVTLWMIIWSMMALLCFSSHLYKRKWSAGPPHVLMITMAIATIALAFISLDRFQSWLDQPYVRTYLLLLQWLIRMLCVVAVFAVNLFLLKLVRSQITSLKNRLFIFGGIALAVFIFGVMGHHWLPALSLGIMVFIVLMLMDMTIDEKKINFLWMSAWILAVAFYSTILWWKGISGWDIDLIDFFNYFSLSFVGGLILLISVIILNTAIPTSWGWQHVRIPDNLLLRHKIELTTLGTLFIAFSLIGSVTYLLEKDRENKLIQEQLGAIQYGAPSDFILQDGFEIKRYDDSDFILDHRTDQHQIDLPQFEIWSQEQDINQPIVVGDEAVWQEKQGTLAAFRPVRQRFIEAFGRSLISKLFNIYVFLFLVCLGVVYIVAQSMTRPLSLLGEQLEQISLGRTNPKIEWKQNDEIGQLINRYNSMLEQLDQSVEALAHTERDQAWKEMAKQVAHEIKNPLTPMKLSIQYLQMKAAGQEGALAQQVKKTSQTLVEQIDNMTRIAENFSQFGELPKVANQRVLLNDVITSVHDLFRKREDMNIQCRVPIDDCFVFADKDHLIRIFNNIIKNAIQAIPRDREGEILVQLTRKEHVALVSISDNGEGITEDRVKKVFQPNFTTKRSGTGLGLAMCSKMIESMDGRIYFETEVNEGTTFYVEIPLLRIEENYMAEEYTL